MASHEQEEWERDMMSGLHPMDPMHPMLLDQAPEFPQYQDQVDAEPMDWWPRYEDLQVGFDPVSVAGPAEPAATPAYQPYHGPPMEPTEDAIVARDYAMYDYGAGSEEGGREGSVVSQPAVPSYTFPQQPPQEAPRPITGVEDRSSWTYAVEVKPACDFMRGENQVLQNIVAIQDAFKKKGIDYQFCVAAPDGNPLDICRCYILPRCNRDNERIRLDFLQIFNANRSYNLALPDYHFKMSVVGAGYDPKSFQINPDYRDVVPNNPHSDRTSVEVEPAEVEVDRFSPTALNALIDEVRGYDARPDARPDTRSDSGPLSSSPATAPTLLTPLTPPEAHPSPPASVQHAKIRFDSDESRFNRPIAKPERQVHKNSEGKFECSFPNCTEEVKIFSRKCEWSKHMDKHDRPYRCKLEGCEKLPGFTYGGGLLRHQREVHGQHGGPRNPLNCPHTSCKRHTGKGFSRLENLNEHLRRVHTGDTISSLPAGEDSNEGASASLPVERTGEKRKAADDNVYEEVKRLKLRNDFLETQMEAHKRHHIAMMEKIRHMESIISANAGPPAMPQFEGSVTHPSPY